MSDYYSRLLALSYSYLVLSLALFASARLALLLTYGDDLALDEVLPAFTRGARFDAKTAVVLMLLPLLAALLLGVLRGLRGFSLLLYRAWLSLALVASTLLALINHFYYRNFQNHIDIFIFGLVEDDTRAVFATIWENYPWLLFLVLFALFGGGLVHGLGLLAWRLYYRPRALVARVLYVPIVVLLLLVAARGSLGVFPLSTDTHLAVSPSNFVNRSVVNGVYALYDAFENRHRSSRPQPVSAASAQAAYQRLRELEPERYPEAMPPAAELFIEPPSTRLVTEPRPHVVLVLRESFGTQLLNFHSSDNDLLGALAQHWQQDIVFTNFVSATLGTHSSLEKILFGLPMSDLTLSKWRKLAFPSSLARFYQDQGYQSSYITGGNKNWHDLDLVLGAQGFAELYDQVDIAAELERVEYDGNWGVFDEYAYSFAARLLQRAQQPQFIFILTTSNHSPYSVPTHYSEPRPQLSPELRKIAFPDEDSELEQILQAYQYANHAFGQFLSSIKGDSKLAATTIVAATGDHHSRDIIRYDADPELLAFRHLVPLYLYLPPSVHELAHYHPERVGSHWDIATTLSALTHPDRARFAYGHNMLALDYPRLKLAHGSGFYLHQAGAISGGKYYNWLDVDSKRLQPVATDERLQQALQWQQARYTLLNYWFGEFLAGGLD